MKRLMFLFGMLALVLSASAIQVKTEETVEYQSDVGISQELNITSDFSSAAVINFECSDVPVIGHSLYSVMSSSTLAGVSIIEELGKSTDDGHSKSLATIVLYGYNSTDSPPDSRNKIHSYYSSGYRNFRVPATAQNC